MRFKKGHYRFVFVFPSLGIAIKFPRIYVFTTISIIVQHFFHFRFKYIYQEMRISLNNPIVWGYKALLFRGIVGNWREFLFYRKTKNQFLQPTYFSLFGLINFQKAGEPCVMKTEDVWCQLYELTDGRVWDDGHHFGNPENFCFCREEFRMLDYGSLKTHRVVTECGKKIVECFDATYDWEKIKRARAAQKQ